jgi:hypothetical protein
MRAWRSRLAGLRAARWRLDHGRRPLPKMIEMAKRRNRAHARRARFITASFEESDLGDEIYDPVFDIHVAALHESAESLDVARRRLAVGGGLYLFGQASGWKASSQAEEFGAALSRALKQTGFGIEATLVRISGPESRPPSLLALLGDRQAGLRLRAKPSGGPRETWAGAPPFV